MRGGSDPTMMILVLMMMMSSSCSLAAGAYYYFNLGEEGDVCTIEDGDPLGVYKLDKDLKCVKEGCVTGTTSDGTNCVVDRSDTSCTIEEAIDGTLYVTNLTGVCEFSMCSNTHILATSEIVGEDAYCQKLDCSPGDDAAALANATYTRGADGECVRACDTGYAYNADETECVVDATA